MRSSLPARTCLTLACFLSPGCGGDVVGDTAAGGSGGAASTGGAGSGGATSTDSTTPTATGRDEGACSAAEKALAYDSPPPLGHASPPASPTTAVVVDVTDTTLEYTLTAGGEVEIFDWRGPPLTEVFAKGETVTVGVLDDWHFVAGAMVAFAYTEYQFVPPDVLPAVPMSKAPVLAYVEQCTFAEAQGACGLPGASVALLALRAGLEPDAVLVPVGATQTAGGHQVHNVQSSWLPGYGTNDCILEALFMSGVTVLGPAGKSGAP